VRQWRGEHGGGLDAFMLKAKADVLSPRAEGELS
jgi:hypothetical protein